MFSNRRSFLKTVAAAGGSAVSATQSRSQGSTSTTKDNPPFCLIWEGEWNDIPCADYPLTAHQWVEEVLTPLANTHVDALAYNLCSSDGYVCELKTGELLCRSVDQFDDSWYWRYRENTKRLIASGANPPDLAVKYGHEYGLKVIPVIRMNDAHDQFFALRHEVSDFKRNHPEYLLGHPHWEEGIHNQKEYALSTTESFTWGLLDYSHKVVRDRKLAVIHEFVTRWDNDGVMLDFDRDPMYFWPPIGGGSKPENQKKMTDLVRAVHSILDEVAAERGKKQFLMVRVLPKIEACRQRGLDVATWVKEGLVQVVIPGAGYAPMTLDLKPWLELVEGKECWVYPSNNHWKPTRQTRGWALQMRAEGAHGLYLFNWGHLIFGYKANELPLPPPRGKNWRDGRSSVWYREVHPDFYTALSEIGDVASIQFKNKSYQMDSYPHETMEAHEGKSFRLFRAIEDVVLPVKLSVGVHEIPFQIGDDLELARSHGFRSTVQLRMVIANHTYPDLFDVRLNGTLLDNNTRSTREDYIMNSFTKVEYSIPGQVLQYGRNLLQIQVQKTNPQMRLPPEVQTMEVNIEYI